MHVSLENIVKSFDGVTVLSIDRWELQPGEVVGLVGSNGAGKTTFLRLVLDLLHPESGEVRIDGRSVSADLGWRARTGSYLDRSFLIEYLTVGEYCRFVGQAFGMTPEESDRALQKFDRFLPASSDDRTKLIRDLSTGNAKKVGITAAMFVEPELLVLDEPFANLDPPSQIQLKDYLAEMAARDDRTMIISSHDLGHVTDVCPRISLIDHGTVVRDTRTSKDTLTELKSYFSARPVGAEVSGTDGAGSSARPAGG
ncbi:MAG: ABC transporter ATP-binding protein [Rhodothermales bacterium]|nr:ABC transporter ATP-binding protein [Rhodothermales bacterium]